MEDGEGTGRRYNAATASVLHARFEGFCSQRSPRKYDSTTKRLLPAEHAEYAETSVQVLGSRLVFSFCVFCGIFGFFSGLKCASCGRRAANETLRNTTDTGTSYTR